MLGHARPVGAPGLRKVKIAPSKMHGRHERSLSRNKSGRFAPFGHYLRNSLEIESELKFEVIRSTKLVNNLLIPSIDEIQSIILYGHKIFQTARNKIYCPIHALLGQQTRRARNETGAPLATYVAILS
jgi:hypothetical protein